MERVKGKVAIITGAAKGLGAAAAKSLHAEGASVIIADVDADSGTKLASALAERALFLNLDVTQEAQWIDAISTTLDRFGRLDVLVNNAGVVVMGTIEDTTLDQLKFVQSVNVEGPFLGCKHALPAMVQSGGGSIINISSVAAMIGTPPFAAYSASKGAVASLTQTVAVHCKMRKNGIRCNSIHPGGMDTGMTASLLELGKNSPLATELLLDMNGKEETVGTPEDVAEAVVYLASDESKYVNGAKLVIDNASSLA